MASREYELMKQFYETSEIGHQFAKPLKEGATAIIEFEGDPETYTMVKHKGRSVLKPGKPKKAEIYFWFSKAAVDYLFNPPTTDPQEYVNRLLDCLLDKEKPVKMKLLTSIVNGWRMGYVAMLKLGGPRAIATIAKLGIKIPARFLK